MALPLRDYQQRTLDALERYFDEATRLGAKRAFVVCTDRPYHEVPQLPALPHVCLRVPTGGGKTLMAAHAVGIAAARWVRRDRVTCLWLTPSNAIRDQTLARLRTPGDPYREALAAPVGGALTVLSLGEALAVTRGTLDADTVVVVATVQALRVADTEGRKVYEANGALAHHFSGLDPSLLAALERREDGAPVESLADVLALRHPVVIVDEAHNVRGDLSFETLARVAPSCVVEFTATPDTRPAAPDAGRVPSNVLAHVSAAELKAEEMVKLPVRLWSYAAWTDAVAEAVARRHALEQAAAEEARATSERVRPMILFQAQPQRAGAAAGTVVTPEVLREHLIETHRVPREQIAVATGTTRELDGVDVNDPACPLRYVITVQALREGWDCPPAYVLCSVAEQGSERAVEQILGRVLRLPGARRKRDDALNIAYAYVVSASFAAAAARLRDGLVDNGFERLEAAALVEEGAPGATTAGLPLFYATPVEPVRRTVRESPAPERWAALPSALRGAVTYDAARGSLTLTAPVSSEGAERLAECFAASAARAEVLEAAAASRDRTVNPALGVPLGTSPRNDSPPTPKRLVVPQLAVQTEFGLEPFDEEHFLEDGWRVAACDPVLGAADYPREAVRGAGGELDVSAEGRLHLRPFQDQIAEQLALLTGEPGWSVPALAVWLDRHIPHRDLTQPDAQLFLHRAIEALVAEGVDVGQLARDKYRLRAALERKIAAYREAARGRAYQHTLLPATGTPFVVTPDVATVLDATTPQGVDAYAPNELYAGGTQFRRHLFPRVAKFDSGPEYACAVHLDTHPRVECWVRNLSGRPRHSFSFQTATDRFYPDFVGRLRDGRIFAVEVKGEDRWHLPDSEEKRKVGALWAEASAGRCVFVMPRGEDWAAVDATFAAG